jgi:hypothetical protein
MPPLRCCHTGDEPAHCGLREAAVRKSRTDLSLRLTCALAPQSRANTKRLRGFPVLRFGHGSHFFGLDQLEGVRIYDVAELLSSHRCCQAVFMPARWGTGSTKRKAVPRTIALRAFDSVAHFFCSSLVSTGWNVRQILRSSQTAFCCREISMTRAGSAPIQPNWRLFVERGIERNEAPGHDESGPQK